jgi:hypothetical protein
VDAAYLLPQRATTGEAEFRYRWAMLDKYLVLTVEQPDQSSWQPVLRWVVEKRQGT